jgi:hypothetical protein
MAECVGDAVAERGAEFPHLGLPPRQEQTLLAPELPPDRGKSIGKGRAQLAIPSGDAGSLAGPFFFAAAQVVDPPWLCPVGEALYWVRAASMPSSAKACRWIGVGLA